MLLISEPHFLMECLWALHITFAMLELYKRHLHCRPGLGSMVFHLASVLTLLINSPCHWTVHSSKSPPAIVSNLLKNYFVFSSNRCTEFMKSKTTIKSHNEDSSYLVFTFILNLRILNKIICKFKNFKFICINIFIWKLFIFIAFPVNYCQEVKLLHVILIL